MPPIVSDQLIRRGPHVTMTFARNPDLQAWLQAWSDEVPTLNFLDICAANVVKLSRETLEQDARKANLVDRLRRLDRPQNSFSYLLALIEKVNDPRSRMTDRELEAQIRADVAAVRTFFTHARVIEQDDFLNGYARALRGKQHELSQDAYLQFLELVNDRFKLGNPTAMTRRLQMAEAIVKEADALSIARSHPVVLVVLGSLYGNVAAKKVLKFKADVARFEPENALADIMVISRFIPRKLEIEQMAREGRAPFARCDVITDDTGLAGILRCFEGEAVRSEERGSTHRTHITVSVKTDQLFPDLPVQDWISADGTAAPARLIINEIAALRALIEV